MNDVIVELNASTLNVLNDIRKKRGYKEIEDCKISFNDLYDLIEELDEEVDYYEDLTKEKEADITELVNNGGHFDEYDE